MGSGRGRERYGVVGREVATAVDAFAQQVVAWDTDLMGGRDAMDLVTELARIEHVVSAALMSAGLKVARTDLWKWGGHSTPAQWLSRVTGVSVAEAISLLDTAEVVESAPDTREALRAGALSPRQAKAIGRAEKVDPDAGRRLLDQAGSRSTRETETDSNRIIAAASSESPAEKAQRHRTARRFRHGVNDDGMGWGTWLLPIAEHTRAVALIEGEQQAVFDQARLDGQQEPSEAYAADALCRVLDRAASKGAPTGSAGGSIDDGWSFAKVIVKVDLTALDRGSVEPGEVCEVAGQGPIPVTDVWHMIDGDAFIAAVTTRGSEISKVVHLGRKPTVLQRTALEALGDGTCQVEGCTSRARLEIDHVTDWAATHRTELNELARVCGHHHDLKTHHRHTFGPLLANGKRALIPPDHHVGRRPDLTGPPELTLVEPNPSAADAPAHPAAGPPGHGTTGPPGHDTAPAAPPPSTPAPGTGLEERARAIGRRGQGHLFDTG